MLARDLLSAKTTFEVEIAFTGIALEAEPDIGVGRGVEDIEITDFGRIDFESRSTHPHGGAGYSATWRTRTLLKGLDPAARKQLFANILELCDERDLATELLANADD